MGDSIGHYDRIILKVSPLIMRLLLVTLGAAWIGDPHPDPKPSHAPPCLHLPLTVTITKGHV
jgi:hypothetical protein